jgi:predicted kinase/predicted phosphodiesterase
MRNLILLRGVPGTGKSTWLKEKGLQQYSISPDDLRMMIQSPVLDIYGKKYITQKNDKLAWDLVFQIVEERMKKGEFTIVDGTHSRAQRINQSYKELCQKYHYRCSVIDFSDTPLEVAKQRNISRNNYKIVPNEVLDCMMLQIKEEDVSNWCKVIKPEDYDSVYPSIMNTIDLNKYDKIHFIGDIHGCIEPLKEYFEKNDITDESQYYIFVGDYVDRGIQNKEVLKFLISISKRRNVLLLQGNHDEWTELYANDKLDMIRSREFIKYTIPQIVEINKKDLREFCRKIGQIAWFEFDGKRIFVNHGGIPNYPSVYVGTTEYIKGVGKYEEIVEVQNSWNNNTKDNEYQIHGHRNNEVLPIKNGRCFNLCDKVEFGGNMRFLQLDKDSGFTEILIKNNTFFIYEEPIELSENSKEELTVERLVELLSNNKMINVKNLDGNISSFNFNRDVFYDKKWDDLTTKARGLFINTKTNKIVARFLDKFFNLDERDSTKLAELRRTLKFPVNAFVKYNGYLGLVGYDGETDSVIITSKSTTMSDFAKWFKEILYSKVDESKLKEIVKSNDITLAFEVLDMKRDPHIIDYGDLQDIILLDAVYNQIEIKRYDYKDLVILGKELGVTVKKLAVQIENPNHLWEFCKDAGNYNYLFNGEKVEGFVLEDQKGQMVKLKCQQYKFWKWMRGVLENMRKGRSIDTRQFASDEMAILVYAFMKKHLLPEQYNLNIIEVRKLYEEYIKNRLETS